MTPLIPMNEAPAEASLVRRKEWLGEYWQVLRDAYSYTYGTLGYLPLPASASEEDVAACAVAWLNRCSPEARERALADHVPDARKMVAENERLREALRNIVSDCEADYPPSVGAIKHAARAALEDSNV